MTGFLTRSTLTFLMLSAGPVYAQRPQQLPVSAVARTAIIDTVVHTISQLYVLPDKAQMMNTALRRAQKAGIFDTISDPNILASAITRTVRSAHRDTHLRIAYDPQEAALMADT